MVNTKPSIKRIKPQDMTTECLQVQAHGEKACKACQYKGTDQCGGKNILKMIKDGAFPKTGLGEDVVFEE